MTKPKTPIPLAAITAGLCGGISVDLKKSRIGAVMLLSGVVSVDSLSDSVVVALSHSGRVFINGERMTVSVLENKTLAVYGRIISLEFDYGRGKNAKA